MVYVISTFFCCVELVPSQVSSQLSSTSSAGTAASIMKSDRWEFPRHRLKFFNVLGQGAFGLVWRCEATDMVGKCVCAVCIIGFSPLSTTPPPHVRPVLCVATAAMPESREWRRAV